MAVSKRLRYEIFRRDNHICRYCGRSAPEVKLTVDHVVPETLGGTNDPSNLVTACADCNSGKSATPPDAPLVEDVKQDAIRWAQAQRIAAERMLAEYDRRQGVYDAFCAKWSEWTRGDRSFPLPANWERSIDSFVAAGLPMPILLSCVDKAMANSKVYASDVFRYMCGIAWKRVTELQEAARQIVQVDDQEDVPEIVQLAEDQSGCTGCYGAGDMAVSILEELPEAERKEAISRAESMPVDERLYRENPAAEAAYLAVVEMEHTRAILTRVIDGLVGVLPIHLHEEAYAEVLERMGDDHSEYHVAANTIRHLTRAIESGQVKF